MQYELHPAHRPTRLAPPTYPGWVVFALWFAVTFVGGLAYVIPMIVVYLFFLLIGLNPDRIEEFSPAALVLASILSGAACGSTIGLGQWLVLRREIRETGRWIAATTGGYASIGLLILIGNLVQPGWLTWGATLITSGKMHWIAGVRPEWVGSAWLPGAITLVLFGAVLGMAQWLVLRHYVRGAGWWILFSAAGWALAAALSALEVPMSVFVLTFELPYLIGGVGLVWLIRRRPSAS